MFAGLGVHDGWWNRGHGTNNGGDAIRPDTVADRTFYYGITAEREVERKVLAWGMREWGEGKGQPPAKAKPRPRGVTRA